MMTGVRQSGPRRSARANIRATDGSFGEGRGQEKTPGRETKKTGDRGKEIHWEGGGRRQEEKGRKDGEGRDLSPVRASSSATESRALPRGRSGARLLCFDAAAFSGGCALSRQDVFLIPQLLRAASPGFAIIVFGIVFRNMFKLIYIRYLFIIRANFIRYSITPLICFISQFSHE